MLIPPLTKETLPNSRSHYALLLMLVTFKEPKPKRPKVPASRGSSTTVYLVCLFFSFEASRKISKAGNKRFCKLAGAQLAQMYYQQSSMEASAFYRQNTQQSMFFSVYQLIDRPILSPAVCLSTYLALLLLLLFLLLLSLFLLLLLL